IPIIENDTIEAIPISNPGETIGLEFDDGKIMLTEFENIFNINWELLKERVGLDIFSDKLEIADIIGMGHWSLIPELTNIWKKMLDTIIPSINTKDMLFFVDLSDIKKRSKEDILEMLNTLKKIEDFMPVLLSLNDQEAIDISKALDGVDIIDPSKPEHSGYHKAGLNINKKASLSYLVIHSPYFATITTKNHDHFWITEGYTSKPRFTTGAGDHFHSGTVAGLSSGLSPAESILLGNALTAIFVRTGESPNLEDLEKFVSKYIDYIEKDNPNI
ncbi:MAG: PfkB family carbohydrate kinase, partial [Promethearchaeota archaeon]